MPETVRENFWPGDLFHAPLGFVFTRDEDGCWGRMGSDWLFDEDIQKEIRLGTGFVTRPFAPASVMDYPEWDEVRA